MGIFILFFEPNELVPGLDPSSYHHTIRQEADSDGALFGLMHASDEEKYKDCERLVFNCQECGQENIIQGPLTESMVGVWLPFNE